MTDAMGIKHVPGGSLSDQTAQTARMVREEAISQKAAGATEIWMGRTAVPPHTDSGPHHHGHPETCIDLSRATRSSASSSTVRNTRARPHPATTSSCRPYVHHIEENAHDVPAVVGVPRSTQGAIVENLEHL